MGSLEAQKDLINERMGAIEGRMAKIRDRRDKARAEYDNSIERGNAVAQFLGNEDALLSEAEANLKASEERMQLLVKQIYDTEAQIRSLNDSLTTVRALRDRFDGYIYSVKRLMNDAKSDPALSGKIKGLIADIVSCDKDYEVAVETAFGGAMQNVVTGTRDDARELIEYLKRTRAGQVTFLPIDAMKPRYENDQIKAAVRDKGAIGFAIDIVKYDKQFESVIQQPFGQYFNRRQYSERNADCKAVSPRIQNRNLGRRPDSRFGFDDGRFEEGGRGQPACERTSDKRA